MRPSNLSRLVLSLSIAAALGLPMAGCTKSPAPVAAAAAHLPPPWRRSWTNIPMPSPTRCAPPTWRWTSPSTSPARPSAAPRPIRSTGWTRPRPSWCWTAATCSIQKAEGQGADGNWSDLKFALGDKDPILGSKLTIEAPTPPGARCASPTRPRPRPPACSGWTPSMTEGKQTPFMFSQSQQIHARCWVPLQDTPRVRFTYERARHRADGRDGADERRQRSGRRARRRLPLHHAAADPVLPAGDRRRRPGVQADRRAHRRLGGAGDGRQGGRPSSSTPTR